MAKIQSGWLMEVLGEYGRHLKEGGRSWGWYEFKDEYSDHTYSDVLEQVVHTFIYFGGQAKFLDEDPHHMDALEHIVSAALQEMLIQIRDGQQKAKENWQELEQKLLVALKQKNIDKELLHWLLLQITDMGYRPSDSFLEVTRKWMADRFEVEEAVDVIDELEMQEALLDLAKNEVIDTEFSFYEVFANQMTHLPQMAATELIINFLCFDEEKAREAALLFLLHPNKDVRNNILGYLCTESYQSFISSLGLRRLITIRNWLCEEERILVDSIIRDLRISGLEVMPAKIPEGTKLIKNLVSSIDGAGAQTILSFFRMGDKYRLIGAVIKERYGLIDVWCTPLSSKEDCNEVLLRMSDEVYCLETSMDYLQEMLPYGLSLNLEANQAVPPEVLMWLELLGLDAPHPQPLNHQYVLHEWQKENPELLGKGTIKKSLETSSKWHWREDFTLGWFEQDDEAERVADGLFTDHGVGSAEAINLSANLIMEGRREKWFTRFVHLALWAKSNAKKRGPIWKDFAIVAGQLNEGVPMREIPIMGEIANKTLEYYMELRGEAWWDDKNEEVVVPADEDDELPSSVSHIIDEDDLLALELFLEHEDRALGTQNVHQIQGMFFALACAPVDVSADVWLPSVFGGLGCHYRNKKQRDQIVGIMLDLYDCITDTVLYAVPSLPCEIDFADQGCRYLPLRAWCQGLIEGIKLSGGLEEWCGALDRKVSKELRAEIDLVAEAAYFIGNGEEPGGMENFWSVLETLVNIANNCFQDEL
ncbi:MAG: YecA family protein [Pseudomonadales bacterium]|nr:YecA family protein [Pseudomonadales bacterium]